MQNSSRSVPKVMQIGLDILKTSAIKCIGPVHGQLFITASILKYSYLKTETHISKYFNQPDAISVLFLTQTRMHSSSECAVTM